MDPRIAENRENGKRRDARTAARRRTSKFRSKTRKMRRQRRRAALCRTRQRARGLDERTLRRVSASIFGELLHHKQVLSVALVTLGVLYSAKLTIHEIGTAMARVRDRARAKYGIKQADRYLSNEKIKPVVLREGLVRAVVGQRKRIEVTMDWTDHDRDDQSASGRTSSSRPTAPRSRRKSWCPATAATSWTATRAGSSARKDSAI